MGQRPWDRADLGGVVLEYETRGAGEPVVLVHAGICADWFKPLLEEPALAGRYRLLSYHRVGYAGSSRVAGPGARNCCSIGSRRPRLLSSPRRRTCFICRIRAAWRRVWPPSSRVTRSRNLSNREDG